MALIGQSEADKINNTTIPNQEINKKNRIEFIDEYGNNQEVGQVAIAPEGNPVDAADVVRTTELRAKPEAPTLSALLDSAKVVAGEIGAKTETSNVARLVEIARQMSLKEAELDLLGRLFNDEFKKIFGEDTNLIEKNLLKLKPIDKIDQKLINNLKFDPNFPFFRDDNPKK